MTLAKLECVSSPLQLSLGLNDENVALSNKAANKAAKPSCSNKTAPLRHALILLPLLKDLPADLLAAESLTQVLQRRDLKVEDLRKTPVALDLQNGVRCVYAMLDLGQERFTQLSGLRKAAMLLLEENPRELALAVFGAETAVAGQLLREALYVLCLNGVALPSCKKKPTQALQRIVVHGEAQPNDFSGVLALAEANSLARELTALPPNVLTPADYRERLRKQAKICAWRWEEYDYKRLQKMGAGAFCAVAQGSHAQDAAIVHLSWQPKEIKGIKGTKGSKKSPQRVALVGKGICFDTGGHNLKPAKYMAGMHEDMNGSAVALALLQAIQALNLPLAVDVWLAIAQNHLSPLAYKQNDIVTALDGSSIEIVHTDAEGRLVLADTLCLATRDEQTRPDLLLDFATLTGSMIAALGNRYAGVFASHEALAAQAVLAGRQSGERVCVFPLDEDYEVGLESKVADIKQCTLEGEADHILAARFLKRFTHDTPWLHMDLSAANCSGGLGAVASDITGFGVAWGVALLAHWLEAEKVAASA